MVTSELPHCSSQWVSSHAALGNTSWRMCFCAQEATSSGDIPNSQSSLSVGKSHSAGTSQLHGTLSGSFRWEPTRNLPSRTFLRQLSRTPIRELHLEPFLESYWNPDQEPLQKLLGTHLKVLYWLRPNSHSVAGEQAGKKSKSAYHIQ